MFMAILTFAAGNMFIVRHRSNTTYGSKGTDEEIPEEVLPFLIQSAVWTCAAALSTVMLCLTCQALLNKSLDEPGTLKMDNRYVRLSMRAMFIVVVACLPLTPNIDTHVFLGVVSGLLLIVSIWEWNLSLERNGALIEPRGITHMLSGELKPVGVMFRREHAAQEDGPVSGMKR
jgi:hypothetical protein